MGSLVSAETARPVLRPSTAAANLSANCRTIPQPVWNGMDAPASAFLSGHFARYRVFAHMVMFAAAPGHGAGPAPA